MCQCSSWGFMSVNAVCGVQWIPFWSQLYALSTFKSKSIVPATSTLNFYPILSCVNPILSCVYPIRFSVYTIAKTVYQVLRLSYNRFCVGRISGFALVRFCVCRISGFAFFIYQVLRLSCKSKYLNFKKKLTKKPEISYILLVLSGY